MRAVPLYEGKEPYMPAADGGHGFQGVLLFDVDEDRVQCHICGKWFPHVGIHLKAHGITAAEYKRTYGLRQKTALCNENTRVSLIVSGKKAASSFLKSGNSLAAGRRFQSKNSRPIEWRNTKALCPAQLLDRIKAVAKTVGRTPTDKELVAAGLGRKVLTYSFGSVKKALELSNLTPRDPAQRIGPRSKYDAEPALILELLENFKTRFERVPSYSDFRRLPLLPDWRTVQKYFGSIKNVAKILGWAES